MNQDQFVARRQAQWHQLQQILGDMQRMGPARMPLSRVTEVGRLYRQTASDLAYARTYYPGSSTARYLNDLVSRAHSIIYAEEPQRWKSLWHFWAYDVPRAIRRQWKAVVLAFALFAAGMLVGCFATLYDRSVAEALVPQPILERVVSPQERYQADVAERPQVGTIIMLNNIKVSVLAFASGITLGIGSALALFYNGLIGGAVVAHSVWRNDFVSLWAHLLAHGALELMAIFLCGGAGLTLGWAIVAPGPYARATAVAQAGRQAVTMVAGAVPMFVVAAMIEGFITPSVYIPDAGKFLVAVLTGLAALAWWLLPGRPRKGEAPPTGALAP